MRSFPLSLSLFGRTNLVGANTITTGNRISRRPEFLRLTLATPDNLWAKVTTQSIEPTHNTIFPRFDLPHHDGDIGQIALGRGRSVYKTSGLSAITIVLRRMDGTVPVICYFSCKAVYRQTIRGWRSTDSGFAVHYGKLLSNLVQLIQVEGPT